MSKELLIPVTAYLLIISVLTSVVTVADKFKAKKGSFRIPEKSLFILAFLGGSAAEYITMRLIRHKTLHKSFMIGLPVIMLFQLVFFALIVYMLYFT